MTYVKICGIREAGPARHAVAAGADFLGFNFVPASRRFIRPENALDIIGQLGGQAKIVGVFKDAPIGHVRNIAALLELDFVQLHGTETPEYVRELGLPAIKAFSPGDNPAPYDVPYFLLDRPVQGEGQAVDIIQAAGLAERIPLFLAGGLTPENVAQVVASVRPLGVDVAGGIETDGVQDTAKITLFINHAKGVTK